MYVKASRKALLTGRDLLPKDISLNQIDHLPLVDYQKNLSESLESEGKNCFIQSVVDYASCLQKITATCAAHNPNTEHLCSEHPWIVSLWKVITRGKIVKKKLSRLLLWCMTLLLGKSAWFVRWRAPDTIYFPWFLPVHTLAVATLALAESPQRGDHSED